MEAMNVLTSPFVRLWSWVDQTGGFPGKVIFVIIVIMTILGVITWVGGGSATARPAGAKTAITATGATTTRDTTFTELTLLVESGPLLKGRALGSAVKR